MSAARAVLVPLGALAAALPLVWAARSAPAAPAAAPTGTVTLDGPAVVDTLRDPTPRFTVRTSDFPSGEAPVAVTLQIARRADFAGAIVLDTTAPGGEATFVPARLLPERTQLVWRAQARTASGAVTGSRVEGPFPTGSWLTLHGPGVVHGTTLTDRRPSLAWSSARVRPGLGAWRYDVRVTDPWGIRVAGAEGLRDTVFRPAADLDASTPYRWAVEAHLPGGDTVRAQSAATFTIVGSDLPRAMLLYQSFPNPFPSAASASTCLWFDLDMGGRVRLDIVDLRGHRVRRLVPGPSISAVLPAGRYGRGADGISGCDPRLSWDGTADDGRAVPPGVYLAQLHAGGRRLTTKMLFRGR